MAAERGQRKVFLITRSISFTPQSIKRIPDPSFEHEHSMECVIMYVPAVDVPPNLPNTPNARTPKINRQIHREIEASLLSHGENVPGTFHLKHNGITLVAQSVRKSGANYIVDFGEQHGILDGGHSYEIILNCQKSNKAELDGQYVRFEIHTQVPSDWIPAMAGGRNSSVQVQPMSLANLAGKFNWLKEELAGTPYESAVAWQEGDDGEYTARDLVAFIACFNIDLFPNDFSKARHPMAAYARPAHVLDDFEDEEKGKSFKKARPLLKDIVTLYEHIRAEGADLYNKSGENRRGGGLAFVETHRGKGQFSFPFAGISNHNRLMKGAAFPMLAAFRWLVEEDPSTGEYAWRGGFERVLAIWQDQAPELMDNTKQTSDDLGRSPDAIAKSRPHWSNLHKTLAAKDLLDRQS